ncbi:MAG: FAD-dependent oxidoreductase [Rhodospirillaceae bacterium]|nr:FAD-dependent oxidoreductase [Rhodospirillaceae bacterium]MBT5941132.1 FAD-dependent oxidoreductase [Rhodospirillaceae bacterium]MBT7956974.1 FAD-dependent oxidoreductase [Rhodospirillaceae bacterium]
MTGITRREFGTFVGATALAALPLPAIAARNKADLAASKGPRIVVLGGGWSGLSIAKYLKQADNTLDVVMVERRKSFFSLPLSNLWLGSLIEKAKLSYRFEDAAKLGGYTYFNASMTELDRDKRRIQTDKGWIDYDVLVLAPGVEYDYASFGVKDPAAIQSLKKHYPAGFVSQQEQQIILDQIKNFEQGIFVLTAPPGIYRCAASPYERACLIAANFKQRKIKGKVVLIDSREEPAVNGEGFLAAFEELYGDTIEYMNSTVVEGVNPEAKIIKTDFDEIKFDGGAIYPRTRAARMIEHFGLNDPASPQKEAKIDPFNYNFIGDERVYIAGDCRPMPFSKSASVAHSEGKHIAKVIAARLRGKATPWITPQSICYSLVSAHPKEAILSRSYYRYDQATKQWAFDPKSKSYNSRNEALGKDALDWGDAHFRELFGA